MNGKCPNVIITDGDLAMRNAIRTVFPNAYYIVYVGCTIYEMQPSMLGRPSLQENLKMYNGRQWCGEI